MLPKKYLKFFSKLSKNVSNFPKANSKQKSCPRWGSGKQDILMQSFLYNLYKRQTVLPGQKSLNYWSIILRNKTADALHPYFLPSFILIQENFGFLLCFKIWAPEGKVRMMPSCGLYFKWCLSNTIRYTHIQTVAECAWGGENFTTA